MLRVVFITTKRDLSLAFRRPADIVSALFFFAIVACLFPLAVGPEPEQLRRLGPSILWVAALLSTLLSLPHFFADDYRDGTLEQLALIPQPLGLIVLGKILAHWMISGLPLTLLAPLLGIQFDLSSETMKVLVCSLLIGTPALSGIGAIGAALTLGVRGGRALLSPLILPLYTPVLIFGASAVDAAATGGGTQAHLSLLAAFSLLSLFFSPWPTAAALRIALE